MTISNLEDVSKLITAIPDFPKPGILFRDVFPVFLNPDAVKLLIKELVSVLKKYHLTKIAGLDARGFLLGPAVALELGIGFVPVRKRGKLPGKCLEQSYEKEYGTDYFEIQEGSLNETEYVYYFGG
jgi:adenine phosphoribosyltransferase